MLSTNIYTPLNSPSLQFVYPSASTPSPSPSPSPSLPQHIIPTDRALSLRIHHKIKPPPISLASRLSPRYSNNPSKKQFLALVVPASSTNLQCIVLTQKIQYNTHVLNSVHNTQRERKQKRRKSPYHPKPPPPAPTPHTRQPTQHLFTSIYYISF